MKAVRYSQFGDADVLHLEDVAVPVPAAGQVRVRVAATSFNPVDASIRAGGMQGPIPVALPHTPGIDVAGTVDALAPGADQDDDGGARGPVAVGRSVIGFLPMTGAGASAEFALAPADALVAAPTSVDLADAAALPITGLTAWQALFEHGDLQRGQRVLVNGAGGAVGLYAVQLAVAAGAHVIGVAGPRSAERVRAAGAHVVVDRSSLGSSGELAAAVGGPVDLALNLAPVEPQQLTVLVGLVGDGGRLVNTTVWMPAPSDEGRGVRGVDMFVRSNAGQLAELVRRVDAGELRIAVAERVGLADLPALHARAAAGEVSGKVVVVP
ncbi:NADP-dependent oxidoreductase [Streptomyces sp. NP160]|uniref:NADP-dependent oxidoreductase n=1 Tax=Streptomyces sp. NP160 TaxID=2586637 RepID=UPI001119A995|nr:NADP-dependent oxidoreductase [Streptomyces sp. NP160]TNM70266.1 NADP-dependent oxidoreductase [Streptomyces sp. NP160]